MQVIFHPQMTQITQIFKAALCLAEDWKRIGVICVICGWKIKVRVRPPCPRRPRIYLFITIPLWINSANRFSLSYWPFPLAFSFGLGNLAFWQFGNLEKRHSLSDWKIFPLSPFNIKLKFHCLLWNYKIIPFALISLFSLTFWQENNFFLFFW